MKIEVMRIMQQIKRMSFVKNAGLIVTFLLVASISYSQTQLAGTEQIDVVKTADRVTSNAIKLSENPVIDNDSLSKPKLDYSVLRKEIKVDYQVDHIPPAKLGREPKPKLRHSYVKAGFGNYTTPLFELSINKLYSKKASMGLFLHHLSSSGKLKDVGFPGYSDNEASFFASKFYSAYTLNGTVDYKRNVVHHYGYNANDSLLSDSLTKDNTKQRFSLISVGAELVQSKKDKPKWLNKVALDYYNYSDKFKAQENKIGFDLGLSKHIKKKYLFTFDVPVLYYNNKFDSVNMDNVIFTLQPMIGMEGKRGAIMIGASVAFDVTESSSKTHLYPQAYGHYNIVDDILIFYGQVTGNVHRNSFRSLTEENPFLLSNGNLQNTDEQVTFTGGLRGAISKRMTFNLGVSQGFHKAMPFYVNDTLSPASNRFDVIYDNTSVLNLRGELGYHIAEKLKLLAKVNYFNYTMENEEEPWYKPSITGALGGRYSMRDKIIVNLDVYYMHEQYAKTYGLDTTQTNPVTVVPVKLKGLTDVNLGVEYRYTKNLSAFINFNNIASMRYYRWNQYPSQRFNFIAGLTYSF